MNNFSIIVFVLCTSICATRSDILVTTSKGTVRGRALVSPGNKTFHAFTGIPYGKPPVGKLRFQTWVDLKKNTKSRLSHQKRHFGETGGGPPLPPPGMDDVDNQMLEIISPVAIGGNKNINESEAIFDFESNKTEENHPEFVEIYIENNAPEEADSWDGIIDATTDPNICFQVNSNSDRETEDCLFINVFTTVLNVNDTRKLPVVFGIYGGAFRSGSAGYGRGGPDWFIERDIVVVSFNYRVGPMGFLSTGDTVIPGNAGLKDQQLALRWTYDNIERFGGNKSHITIQGQSAGGASVTYQLLNKKNAGLFEAALVNSGNFLCPWAWTKSNTEYTIKLANTINNNVPLSDTSSAFLLQYLQNTTAREVDDASATLYSWRIPLPTLEPEHEGAFITKPMYELLDSGDILKVPLLIGINSEEEISKAANIPRLVTEAAHYDHSPSSLVPSQLGNLSAENRTIVANLIKEAYVGNDTFSNNLGPVVAYTSDNEFTRGVIRFSEVYSRYSPVYFYQFSYKGPMGIYNYSIEGADKVAHGEEGHYLGVVRAGSFDNTKYENFPESDVLTHWRLIELWSNFYKYRNPIPKPIELLSNITWPVVTQDNFVYLNINRTLEIMDTPKSPRYNVWRYVYETFGIRPFVIY